MICHNNWPFCLKKRIVYAIIEIIYMVTEGFGPLFCSCRKRAARLLGKQAFLLKHKALCDIINLKKNRRSPAKTSRKENSLFKKETAYEQKIHNGP